MQQPPGLVWISTRIVKSLESEADRAAPDETGGILIGFWAKPKVEIVITAITGPGPAAIHKPASFVPDPGYQTNEAARYYEESGRLHTYVGDWHTHPGQGAYLSRTDKATLRRIAHDPAARMPIPVMIVLGGRAEQWDLRAWSYEPSLFGSLGLSVKTCAMVAKRFT